MFVKFIVDICRWAHEIVTHPVLVSAVKTVLDTNNILCWSSDINSKPGHSSGHIPWHQDSAYSGLEPSDQVVTAWVCLTPSSPDTGCVHVIPGSHVTQLEHVTGDTDPNNKLVLKQYIPESELTQLSGESVPVSLVPGEVSLHSWRCVHKSGVNTSDQDRVGLAIRYMTDQVQNIGGVVRERATLICGSGGEWWDLETAPNKDYGDKERTHHQESMELERKNYMEGQDSLEYK